MISNTDNKISNRLAEEFYQKTVKPLLDSGDECEQAHEKILTVSDKSVTEFASGILLRRANAGAPQTVLLLSGDGGVIDTLNALLSSNRASTYRKPSLGIVAMGTGNALAYSTGFSKDRTLGLRHFYRGNPHRLPTFTVRFSSGSELLVNEGKDTEPLQRNDLHERVVYGAVVCSWALHASIVADSDTSEYRKHGNQRFIMAANELLHPSDGSPPHVYKGTVSYVPLLSHQNPAVHLFQKGSLHSYVLATMVSHLEPGFHISPHSAPLDGQLRIFRLRPMTAAKMEAILGKVFQDGSHVDDPAVEYESVQSMKIEMHEEDPRWR